MLRFTVRELLLITVIAALVVGIVVERRNGERKLNDWKNATLVTPQFLTDAGFVRDAQGTYWLKSVRLGDAANRLDFSLLNMRTTRGKTEYHDTRYVKIRNLIFLISSLATDENGNVIPKSLDDSDTLVNIACPTNQKPPKKGSRNLAGGNP